MKKNHKLWKALILCMAIMLSVIMLPGNFAHAEELQAENRTITITPLAYDISRGTLKVQIATNATDCYLAYHMDTQYIGNSEMFSQAVKTTETCINVLPDEPAYIYIWYVDADGNRITSADYDWSYSGNANETNITNVLLENPSIPYENGDALEDFDAQFRMENGKVLFASNDKADHATGHHYHAEFEDSDYWAREFKIHLSENPYSGMLDMFINSGAYEFNFWLEGEGVRSKMYPVTYFYVRPEQSLNTVSDLKWSDEKKGSISFSPVDGAFKYTLTLYREMVNGTLDYVTQQSIFHTNELQADFSNYMTNAGVNYKVGVRAISDNIEAIAHSDEAFSPIYDPSDASESVDSTLKEILAQAGAESVEKADADTLTAIYNNASAEEKVKIADALKEGLCALPVNELKIAMQTSQDTRDTVTAIEAMTGVTVSIDVADNATALLEAGAVSVIGAGLNADAGVTNVTLKITQEPEINMGNGYKKSIPLGITLTGVSNAATGLNIPVKITMPVPAGIDMRKLVILHMNADGTINETLFAGNGYGYDDTNRTITFTVTHFSTFVFAEAVDTPEASNPGGNNGNSNNNNNANSNTSNSNALSNVTTTSISPKTGENMVTIMGIIFTGVIAGAGAVFLTKKSRA